MPAPDQVLLHSLTGHPPALDQTLGCMTGLFHIFEGHPATFMGRRSYSPTTRVGIHTGQSQLTTQTDHRHNRRENPFSKVDDTHDKLKAVHPRSHSDVGDSIARTLTDMGTLKHGSHGGSSHFDPPPTVDALAFYNNESLRAAALFAGRHSDLDHSKRNEVLPKARLHHVDTCPSDIRNAILASFSSTQGSVKTKRDGSGSRTSSSVYARSSYEPAELVNWKEGLRSSASPPRKLSHHNSPERRVEPKVKDRGRSLSRDHLYPFASMSPKRFPGTSQEYSNFKESPGASDFRESLKPFLTGPAAQDGFASRSSADGNLVGVSEMTSTEHSVVPNVIARLMGLEDIPSSHQQGLVSSSKGPQPRCGGDKFFRGLMQFDPQVMRSTSPPPCQSKKYGVHQPSAHCRKEYGREMEGAYQGNYPAQYRLEQELCSSEEDREYEHCQSMPFLPFVDDHQEGAHPASGQQRDLTTHADQDINIVAPEKKKKMIRKILEAMRPKVFLKISRRKQITEQETSPASKLISTNDVQPVQQQTSALTEDVTRLKLPSHGTENAEPPRCTTSDTSSVQQVQEQQTDSSNFSCILQPDEVMMKTTSRSQDSNVGGNIFHVETASSTNSTDKEMVAPTRRMPAQIHNEDREKNQRRARKPGKPRVAVAAENAPRRSSARATSTLESDCESDPSSCTKSNDVHESKKMPTTTRKRNPKSPTPDVQRQNGARSSSRSTSPCKSEHCKTGGKSVVVKAKKDSRMTPTNPKAQLAKEETFNKRAVTENKPSFNKTEKLVNAKETVSMIRSSTGARARSPAAAPRNLNVRRSTSSTTTDAVSTNLDTASNGSNVSALDLQPAPAQPQITSDPEPSLEYIKHEEAQPLGQTQEPTIESCSEELTTPRGNPFHCEHLDGKADEAGALDRPSPVSVLDITTTFEEELTPSPSSPGRYSFPVLQDFETTYGDEGYESCERDMEVYHDLTPALIEDGPDFKCAEELQADQVEKTDTKSTRLDRFQAYFKEEERAAFVESSCRVQDTENAINENLLESLRSEGILQENNHMLLLDCLEEIMERMLESQSTWAGLPPASIKGRQLEQELWIELRDIKRSTTGPPSEDICDTVHRLLQRDLIRCQGPQWSSFTKDREQSGVDMEKMIVEDLVDEAVRDLCALDPWQKPPLPSSTEATRRQLFTT